MKCFMYPGIFVTKHADRWIDLNVLLNLDVQTVLSFLKKFILTEEYIIKIAQNRFEFHISNNSCSYRYFPLSRKPISQQKQEQ